MTKEEAIRLGNKAIVSGMFKWISGMLAMPNIDGRQFDPGRGVIYHEQPNAIPDLRDPATFGCCMSILRSRFGDKIYLIPNDYSKDDSRLWDLRDEEGWVIVDGPTRIHTIVAALEVEDED